MRTFTLIMINANKVIKDFEIKNVLKKVDYKKVFIENKKIFFKDENMSIKIKKLKNFGFHQ